MTPIEQTKRQRRELLQRDRALAATLAAHYAESYRVFKALLTKFIKEIEAARARGAEVDAGWLASRQLWLVHLLARTQAEMGMFARRAEREIEAAQHEAITRAQDDSHALLLLASAASIFGIVRVPPSELADIAGKASNGVGIRSLLERAGIKAADLVHRAVRTGVLGGKDARQISSEVIDDLGAQLTHALTVARTEHLQAYRESMRRTMIANRHNVFGWLWVADLSPATCALCWAMHGTIHEPEETLDSHPNCLVGGAIVYGSKVRGSSTRWYEGEVFDIETGGGKLLTVTPNHPILTSKGWVAARLLNEGSDVVCGSLTEAARASQNPNDNQAPALIEDVAKTCGGAASVVTTSVPTSAEDFHGDGMDGKVCVIRADGALRNAFDAANFEPLLQAHFVRRHIEALGLTSFRATAEFVEGALHAPDGGVSSGGVAAILGGAALGHHQAVGVSPAPPRNPAFVEDTGYNSASDAELLGYRLFGRAADVGFDDRGFVNARPAIIAHRHTALSQHPVNDFEGYTVPNSEEMARFAGEVFVDKVVKIRRRPFAGHVYNLETETGWYVANGIITHNCRCMMLPLVLGEGERIETGVDLFEKLSEAEQREILGEKAFEAMKAGKVKLKDFVGERRGGAFGRTRFVRSLKSIVSS